MSLTEDETDNDFGEENSDEWGLETGLRTLPKNRTSREMGNIQASPNSPRKKEKLIKSIVGL